MLGVAAIEMVQGPAKHSNYGSLFPPQLENPGNFSDQFKKFLSICLSPIAVSKTTAVELLEVTKKIIFVNVGSRNLV